MRLELVRDWMSRDILTVEPDAPVQEVEALMVEHSIRRMPIMEDGHLVGIVTLDEVRDITSGGSPVTTSLRDIMTAEPITVDENDIIGRAAQLMLENKISGIPVTNAGGAVVGIITESDIFRLVVHDWMRSAGGESEPYARYGG